MRTLRQWLLVSLLTLTGTGGAVLVQASAQGPSESQLYQDNQTRAARLSYVKGAVHVDGAGDQLDGVINMPIVEGQRISTGDDGEAEIEFEDGSMVRLTPNSAVELNQMTGDQSGNMSTAIGLLGGVYYMDLRSSDQTHFIVDAADERIEPRENSVVRVRMDDPPAEISLLEGAATVSRQNGFSAEVNSGESIRGDSRSAGRYYLSDRIDEDSWDQWNEQLEQQAANDANLRTDAQMSSGDQSGYGWSDLDAYGNWYDIPGEGQVWQPEQASDPNFDPYGYGNWVYYPTSGYVWVSGYPWGWKPFRCGYWNYYNGFGWGWQSQGCGVRGWGGFGGYGGFSIRIRNFPHGYRPPVRPMPGRGSGWSGGRPPRRVIPIGTRPPISPRIPSREGRPINFGGKTYQPLPRRGGYTQRGGSAVGSGFRRDFPMNRTTNRPDIGRPASQPGSAIVPGAGWRAVDNNRNRNNQGRGSQIAPQNNQPAAVDNRRQQYNGGQPAGSRNNDDRNRNNGGNSNQPSGNQQPGPRQPIGNAIPGANPPVRRNDEGGNPLTVRRPDGTVIQPGENGQTNDNNQRRRRGDYNGRPANQPGTPAPGGVGIPAQQGSGAPQQPAGSDAQRQQLSDEQRQQIIQQRQQQRGNPAQPQQRDTQQQQQIDQQRLQQQRQQQIEQMRQQIQQRQDQQRQQSEQQQRQQQQVEQQRQQQVQQQMREQQQRQLQQQEQIRQQQVQQQRQQMDQQRQQQMQQQIQQRQQQMEQMRQQQQQQHQQQQVQQQSHPAPPTPPQAQQQKFNR